jgi:hypothetical protein
VPDFRADLVRSAWAAATGWAEWHWHGTRRDGTDLNIKGVTIFGVQDESIVWDRLYMDYVQGAGDGIDRAMDKMTRGDA